MATENKSPEVRFAGFAEDWEESTFQDIFSGLSNNSLSREKLQGHTGTGKNIHYGDILVKYGNIVDVQKEKIPFIIEKELVDKQIKSALIDGDVIFADAAEDETVGKCIEVINITNDIVLAGLHTIAVRPQIDFASKYLGYYLNSKSYHNQLLKLMQGTKVLSISKNSISDTVVYYPKKQVEQRLIATYLNKIDELITNHQTQLTKLKNLKKAMLTKLFPQNGASVPEIRFKGFDGEWEEKKLVEIVELGSSKRVHRADYVEFGVPFFRGTEISKLGNASIIKDLLYISEDYYEKLKSNYGVPQIGDILITAVGTLGNAFLIHRNNKFYFKDGNLIWLKNIKISSEYLITFLKNGIGRTRVLESAIGSNQKALTMDKLGDIKIIFPNLQEQQQIGNYFKTLNQIIETHNEQLKKLNNVKKACLSKLFVA